MSSTTHTDFAATPTPPMLSGDFTPADEAALRETLKRCPPDTLAAACQYRRTGDPSYLPAIVLGVITRYVERDLRPKLAAPSDDLRLAEDLGLDSLTMMEIVLLVEDVLRITIASDELCQLRTLGDIQRFLATKLHGRVPP